MDSPGPIELVLDAFAAILGGVRPGSLDDFFALGGNSFKAALVATRLGLGIGSIYERPTAAGLAQLLSQAGAGGPGPGSPAKRTRVVPTYVDVDERREPTPLNLTDLLDNSQHSAVRVGSAGRWVSPLLRQQLEESSPPAITCRPVASSITSSGRRAFAIPRAPIPAPPLVSDPEPAGWLDGQEPAPACLRVAWRTLIGSCVDAAPLLLELDGGGSLVIVGSHASNVVCVCGETGRPLWETFLGGRVEGPACLARDGRHVAVGESLSVLDPLSLTPSLARLPALD